MKIVIIDYDAGNVASVFNALSKIAGDAEIKISHQISDLKSASCIILPGVGSFSDCISSLKAIEGLVAEIRNQVSKEKKPFLGICVGMQVLATTGFEGGKHNGLGLINGSVEKIESPQDANLKIPHMGWNNVTIKPNKHPVLKGIASEEHFYFANSYHFDCQNENNILGSFEYGKKCTAIVAKDNIFATQFHPEKSGDAGLKILENFLKWRP